MLFFIAHNSNIEDGLKDLGGWQHKSPLMSSKLVARAPVESCCCVMYDLEIFDVVRDCCFGHMKQDCKERSLD